MSPGTTKTERSPREELANSLSHGIGFVSALAATPILVVQAAGRGSTANVVGATVFGVSLILLYLSSMWYHAVPSSPLKQRLRRLDHAAIYLLIAGTYTPFTLGVLGGTWGWTLFGIVWAAAAIGVIHKLVAGVRYPRLSTALYLLMGWLIVIAFKPLVTSVPIDGILWLAAGGLAYTGGVVFYVARRPYSHFVWHLFVLTGSVCHFFAVLWYAA
ncbi:MAG: hemolysin III family protein [Gemmatimonadota bacterium]